MVWSNPGLIDLGTGGRAELWCFNGVDPVLGCTHGATDYFECWPGGGMPVPEICFEGISPGV